MSGNKLLLHAFERITCVDARQDVDVVETRTIRTAERSILGVEIAGTVVGTGLLGLAAYDLSKECSYEGPCGLNAALYGGLGLAVLVPSAIALAVDANKDEEDVRVESRPGTTKLGEARECGTRSVPASLEVTLPDQEPMTVRTDENGSATVELSAAARARASQVVVKMAGRPLPVEWE